MPDKKVCPICDRLNAKVGDIIRITFADGSYQQGPMQVRHSHVLKHYEGTSAPLEDYLDTPGVHIGIIREGDL